MTDSNYTHLVLIVDRSGSMGTIQADAEGGVKALIAEQRKLPGRLTVDLWQFDHDVERVGADVDHWALTPRGLTALLDAIGQAIVKTGEELAAKDENERPGTVIVQVTTDGFENSSKEWTKAKIRELIEQQRRDYGWEFIYAGASPDAFNESGDLGFTRGQTITYAPTPQGTQVAYAAASAEVTRSRIASNPSAQWNGGNQ